MDLSKEITIEDVRQVLDIIKADGKKYGEINISYNQATFCGTSCCLWGHASIVAGRYTAKDFFDAQEKFEFLSQSEIHDDLGLRLTDWAHSEDELKEALASQMDRQMATLLDFDKVFDQYE